MLIPAYKDGVVVLGALVEEPFPGKGGHHLRGDASGLAQVSEYPPHIAMGGWDLQSFLLFIYGGRTPWRGAGRQLLQVRNGAV